MQKLWGKRPKVEEFRHEEEYIPLDSEHSLGRSRGRGDTKRGREGPWDLSLNMSYTAILLIILSAIMHAAWNLLAKRGGDILVFLWLSIVFELSLFAPMSIYILHRSTVDPRGWYVALAAGIFTVLFVIFLSNSYKYGDLSLVYPITRSSPIFVAILAVIIFGEMLSPLGVLGIAMVILGMYVIPMRALGFWNFIRPLSHLKSKAILFAGLTALSTSIHHLIDKVGTRFFNPLAYVWLTDLIGFSILTCWIVSSQRRRWIKREWSLNKWRALATGLLVLLSYSPIVYIMRFEKVSYIISMRQISVVFGVMFGTLLLKERYGLIRFIASCLIFGGAFCLGMAD